MKRPPPSVISGIIAATSLYLAGEMDENDPDAERRWSTVEEARAWAFSVEEAVHEAGTKVKLNRGK